jgi:hypothetical protein
MTKVLEARARYDQARLDAKALVDRARAELGLEIHEARQAGTSQTEILKKMGKSREQIRSFEQAYRSWLRDHPGESLTD